MKNKSHCSQFSKIPIIHQGLFVFTLVLFTFFLGAVRPSHAGVDFKQCANQDPTAGDCNWINSIVQNSNSLYVEGMSVPQRLILSDVPASTGNHHSLTFSHDATKAGVHAYDWLTSDMQAVSAASDNNIPFINVSGGNFTDGEACSADIPASIQGECLALRAAFSCTLDVPDDPFISKDGSTQDKIDAYEAIYGNRTIRIYSDSPITCDSISLSHSVANSADTGDSEIIYTLSATSASTNFMVEFAGHIAKSGDGTSYTWGDGLGASAISGGPYHVSLNKLDNGSTGSKDNPIKGADILHDPCAGISCDDGNVCNGTESCNPVDGSCIPGTPLTCDDGNVCNGIESCDAVKGCQAGTPLTCDDGKSCNGTETCDSTNGCQPGTPLPGPCCENDSDCNDGNVCDGTETCEKGACVPGVKKICDDGNACNGKESCDMKDGCQPGTPLVCDDGNVCNGTETCDPASGCKPGVSLICDDGVACNGAETCDSKQGCIAGTPLTCGDGQLDPECGEQCDNDGSNSDTTPGACRTDCSVPKCGDNVTDPGEQCDGTDDSNCDGRGCQADCTCVAQVGEQGGITPICGNGVVEQGEECDDGNTINSDLCTNSCKLVGLLQGSGNGGGTSETAVGCSMETSGEPSSRHALALGLTLALPMIFAASLRRRSKLGVRK